MSKVYFMCKKSPKVRYLVHRIYTETDLQKIISTRKIVFLGLIISKKFRNVFFRLFGRENIFWIDSTADPPSGGPFSYDSVWVTSHTSIFSRNSAQKKSTEKKNPVGSIREMIDCTQNAIKEVDVQGAFVINKYMEQLKEDEKAKKGA